MSLKPVNLNKVPGRRYRTNRMLNQRLTSGVKTEFRNGCLVKLYENGGSIVGCRTLSLMVFALKSEKHVKAIFRSPI